LAELSLIPNGGFPKIARSLEVSNGLLEDNACYWIDKSLGLLLDIKLLLDLELFSPSLSIIDPLYVISFMFLAEAIVST
jgi:hypothetical protein